MNEDIAALKTAIKEATSTHYQRLRDSIPDLYGYCLYTDDDVASIGPVANRENTISVEADDDMYAYYRFGACEWDLWDDFGTFGDVNAVISQIHESKRLPFGKRRKAILQAAVDALVELEAEGVFGPKTDQRFLSLEVSDSDERLMLKCVRLLNTPKVAQSYQEEFFSDE